MKKLILCIFTFFIVNQSNSQTSLNFETWVSAGFGAPADPQGFASANVLVNSIPGGGSPSNPVVASKETTAGNFTEGTSGLKLTTGKLVSNPLSASGFNDTVGFAFSGAISIAGIKKGYPFIDRPDGFSFSSKSQPMATDSNYVYVQLFRGGATKTVVAYGYASFFTPTSSMATTSITLTYPASGVGVVHDSAFVIISASRVKGGKIGSVFYVDDAKFYGGNVGLSEISKTGAKILVYPNPASSFVQFATLNTEAVKIMAYDITGKLIVTEQLENGKAKISTQQFNNGMYMYSLIGKDNQILTTGKFNVDK